MAEAITACLDDADGWRAQTGHSNLLEQSARRIIFDCGALAPVGPMVVGSLVRVAAECDADIPPQRMLSAWEDAVQDCCESYGRDPGGWSQDEAMEFQAIVARCFGVEDDRVPDLIVAFHGMPEGSRFGALMMIEDSPAFQWLSSEIDAFTRTVDLEAPPQAMRRLLRSLHGN